MTTRSISPLRQRMIEDMNARQLGPHTQRSHIYSCERFASFLKRAPDTATADDVRRFQLHLMESGASISNRNRIMTGVKFLLRVTLRRLDLAAEVYHLKEPQRLPLVMSPEEAKRLLAMAGTSKVRALLALGYGCGLRAGEVRRSGGADGFGWIQTVRLREHVLQFKLFETIHQIHYVTLQLLVTMRSSSSAQACSASPFSGR